MPWIAVLTLKTKDESQLQKWRKELLSWDRCHCFHREVPKVVVKALHNLTQLSQLSPFHSVHKHCQTDFVPHSRHGYPSSCHSISWNVLHFIWSLHIQENTSAKSSFSEKWKRSYIKLEPVFNPAGNQKFHLVNTVGYFLSKHFCFMCYLKRNKLLSLFLSPLIRVEIGSIFYILLNLSSS